MCPLDTQQCTRARPVCVVESCAPPAGHHKGYDQKFIVSVTASSHSHHRLYKPRKCAWKYSTKPPFIQNQFLCSLFPQLIYTETSVSEPSTTEVSLYERVSSSSNWGACVHVHAGQLRCVVSKTGGPVAHLDWLIKRERQTNARAHMRAHKRTDTRCVRISIRVDYVH